MYDDNSRTSVKKMKMEMSLDFHAGEKVKKALATKQTNNENLATPDVGLFMLSSPDLERFIIQQNGMVLTTPTPTAQILFPKTVTEEQEAYARGFVDALGELHKNYGKPVNGSTANSTGVSAINPSLLAQSCAQFMTTIDQKPISILPQQSQTFAHQVPPAAVYTTLQTSKPARNVNHQRATPVQFQPKQESLSPQTVPSFVSGSLTPINMDDQESAKLERKRARNRLAATRCRNRKLERISRLEDRVKELKGQNAHLAETASTLREEVFRLKQSIIDHTNNGCQVMLSHNLL